MSVASINGVPLAAAGEEIAEEELRERAWAELLRQEAVRQGRLAAGDGLDEAAIQAMLDDEVPLRAPDAEECERYYAANTQRYVQGRTAQVRHILFAVTPGVDVNALARRAEQALSEVKGAPDRFGALARELSNCPSGREGGELGWIRPEECAPELVAAIFDESQRPGLRPRLVHSRYGLHILDVAVRVPGMRVPFAQVRERIAGELAQRSRATALHQYIRLLAGRAAVRGVDLEAAATPLLQ